MCDKLNDVTEIVACVESKGLTAAVLRTSKMFEEVGDLYARQVNTVSTCMSVVLDIFDMTGYAFVIYFMRKRR